jgi:hypothetical protein
MNQFATICWGITLIASCIAAFMLFGAIVSSQSAPQQAAGAALALGVVVIPYVFTRCIEAVSRPLVTPVTIVPAEAPIEARNPNAEPKTHSFLG